MVLVPPNRNDHTLRFSHSSIWVLLQHDLATIGIAYFGTHSWMQVYNLLDTPTHDTASRAKNFKKAHPSFINVARTGKVSYRQRDTKHSVHRVIIRAGIAPPYVAESRPLVAILWDRVWKFMIECHQLDGKRSPEACVSEYGYHYYLTELSHRV